MGSQTSKTTTTKIDIVVVYDNLTTTTTNGIFQHNSDILKPTASFREKMIPSDYGVTSNDESYTRDAVRRTTNLSVRNSKISKETISIEMVTNLPIDISDNFEYLEYTTGGHFKVHTDRQRFDSHNVTVLLYPPQTVSGGDLIIYDSYEIERKRIAMPSTEWKCVIIPIGVRHSSSEIISGTKTVFKGTGIWKKDINKVGKIDIKQRDDGGQWHDRPYGKVYLLPGESD